MPFFRRREPVPPKEAPRDEDLPELDESIDVDDATAPEEELDAQALDGSWTRRSADVIPGGASTGSKQAAALYGDDHEVGPTHFSRASGCVMSTPADTQIVDCTMALGSVAIGYADESVTRAVMMAAAAGNVAGFSHTSEVEVAERLCEVIPCAEQVRFLKSGAEAVTAAVRIARTATSRPRVVACGYFGWHDWSNSGAGIPDSAHHETQFVPFDDVPALERACRAAGQNLAAVILEPVIERLPSEAWIAAARRLCDELGAVLIFDEIKTGFRVRTGGYQEYSGVTPDLATFGKAMANGYPIAAVVGLTPIMDAASLTWISSTLAGEATALAAVGAVLDRHAQEKVCDELWSIGKQMRESVERAVSASGAEGVTVDGIDPMWLIRFDDATRQRRFLELAVGEGVLFKRGAYNFSALAHGDEEVIVEIERAASSAFVTLTEESEA